MVDEIVPHASSPLHKACRHMDSRKRDKDLQRQCVAWYKEHGWEYIQDLLYGKPMRDENDNLMYRADGQVARYPPDGKIAADIFKTVLAYGFGRPPEKIEVDVNHSNAAAIVELTTPELQRLARAYDKDKAFKLDAIEAEVVLSSPTTAVTARLPAPAVVVGETQSPAEPPARRAPPPNLLGLGS